MFPFLDLHETYTRHWSYKMLVACIITDQKALFVCLCVSLLGLFTMFLFLDLHETYTRHWSYKMLVACIITDQKVKGECHRGHSKFCRVRIMALTYLLYAGYKYNPWRADVLRSISRSKRPRSMSHQSFGMKVTWVIWSFCCVCSMASFLSDWSTSYVHGPLARHIKLRVRMRRECRERFPRHRGWAIPTCITARAWRTCRDACRDR